MMNMANFQSNLQNFNGFKNKNRKLKFNDDLNYQKYLASPYSAHLNFKTFQNFFDVEVCVDKELNGKTQYKLRKINPWKRSY